MRSPKRSSTRKSKGAKAQEPKGAVTTATATLAPAAANSQTVTTTQGSKVGRPSLYSVDLGSQIAELIVNGENLKDICKRDDMPAAGTVLRWIQEKGDFRELYAKARAASAELKFDELQEIADDGSNDWMRTNDPDNPGWRVNGEAIARSRLRADMLRWRLGKMAKKYADVSRTELSGADGGPIMLAAVEARERLMGIVVEGIKVLPKPDSEPDE